MSKFNKVEVLEKAEKDLAAVTDQYVSRLVKELQGTDFWKLRRAYSPGIQEYVEAATFCCFCKNGTLLELDEINKTLLPLNDPSLHPMQINVLDYLLGRINSDILTDLPIELPPLVCLSQSKLPFCMLLEMVGGRIIDGGDRGNCNGFLWHCQCGQGGVDTCFDDDLVLSEGDGSILHVSTQLVAPPEMAQLVQVVGLHEICTGLLLIVSAVGVRVGSDRGSLSVSVTAKKT
ncbi:hypothetical protein V8G54_001854 [Vigna mungo]|uniref:Uncharacterized protein n=1 Tax=Vigna mungo TaxID=3915 RepID=A0AAQ3P7S9_VIGMU